MNSIKKLEHNIDDSERQLKAAQGRERLMIEYPDLNGPVNRDITGKDKVFIMRWKQLPHPMPAMWGVLVVWC